MDNQEDYHYEVDFTELGVTTDELKELTYAEYYQEYFPEAWNDVFTEEEKDYYKTVNFLEDINTMDKAKGLQYLNHLNFKKSSKSWKAKAETAYISGKVASRIDHDIYIQDSSGHGVAGSLSGTTKSTKYYSSDISKPTSTFSKGKKYRAYSKHTMKINGKNYIRTNYTGYAIPRP
ncbi:MAG: hypothetical protein RSF39_10710 [Romboutsia sp.]